MSEQKIRHALSLEPLGPYNSELLDLSILTFEPRKMETVCDVLEKKLIKILLQAHKLLFPKVDHLTRSRSLSTKNSHSFAPPQRSHTFSPQKRQNEFVSQLVTLKCLTVIVYLCQWGSGSFMNWLRLKYTLIVQPLATLAFLPTYALAIYAKVDAVVRFCEDDDALRVSRDSLDNMRLEMRFGGSERLAARSLDGTGQPPLVKLSPKQF